MMRINEAKCATLVRVALLHRQSPDVLSTFEMATLWDLTERALDKDIEAQTTTEEWAVVEGAKEALEKVLPPRLTDRLRGKSAVFFYGDLEGVLS